MFKKIRFFFYELPLILLGIVMLVVVLIVALGYLVMWPRDAREKIDQLFDW
jgi:hypothetical protein